MLFNCDNLVAYAGVNLRKKRWVHGESVFNSGNVIKCGTLPNASSSNVKVHALCVQGTHFRENPFKIDGEVAENGDISSFRCTCGAGVMCKHIIASLLHCLHFELPRLSSTDLSCSWNKVKTQALTSYQPMPMEEHSCFSENSPKTDLRLRDIDKSCNPVLRPALASILPSVVNSNNVNPPTSGGATSASSQYDEESSETHEECDEIPSHPILCDEEVTDNDGIVDLAIGGMQVADGLDEFCYQVFINDLSKSAFGKFEAQRHESIQLPEFTEVTDHDREMFQQIFLHQDCELMEMLKLHKVDPLEECCQETLNKLSRDVLNVCERTRNNFAEWLQERKYIITGTTSYPLYTYCKTNKAPEKWKSKCDDFIEPASFTSDATEYGIKHESKARAIFIKDYPDLDIIETGLVKCPTIEWLGASPDGVVFKDEKPYALLEIRCFTAGKTKNVCDVVESQIGKCLEKSNGDIILKHNHKFYGQVQLGMAILNVNIAYFVIHSSFEKKNFVLEVPKDILFLTNMLTALKRLYYSVLLPEICLRESENPINSCHIQGEHFNFKAIIVKDQSKKTHSKSKDKKYKYKPAGNKNPKNLKRNMSSDTSNKPDKRLMTSLRV